MKKSTISRRLKFLYVFIFIIVLVLLVLPQFSFKIGETEIKYPNIDFSIISTNAKLGNFSKGYNLYNSNLYTAEIVLDASISDQDKNNQFKYLIQTVKDRALFSNLNEVNIYGSQNEDKYYINLQFPQYIEESEKIAQYLIAKGEISFSNDPQASTNPVSLNVGDIEGEIRSIFSEQYGNVLQFRFKQESLLTLFTALQSESGYFLMNVDSSFFAVAQDPNYSQTQSPNLQTSVVAVPFADVKLSPNVAVYTNIVRSYFLTDALDQTINLNSTPVIIKRDFVADRLSYVAILLTVAILFIIFAYINKNGLNKGIRFSLMLLSFITLTVFLLKLQSAALSFTLVLGFVVTAIIAIYIIYKLLGLDEYAQQAYLKEVIKYSIFLALSSLLLFRFLPTQSVVLDVFGVIIAASTAFFFLCLLNFKYILNLDLDYKLPKRK